METIKIPKLDNIYKKDFKNVDIETFVIDLLTINWNEVCSPEKNEPNESYSCFEK